MKAGKSLLFALFLAVCSCTTESENTPKKMGMEGATLARITQTEAPHPSSAQAKVRPPYPWEIGQVEGHHRITKEFFRCRCGISKHSLPLRDGKEHIHQILIDLTNHIQMETEKQVVITCGHRCPEWNKQSDPSKNNRYSKHMMGAEVAFYIKGTPPKQILQIIMDYYKNQPKYEGKPEYLTFKRYEKEDTDVSTPPWYNREIFFKLYTPKEGRDLDNQHPHPYFRIQVREDFATKDKVRFHWDNAYTNYLRWDSN